MSRDQFMPAAVVVREVELSIHVYQVHDQGAVEEYSHDTTGPATAAGQEDSIMTAHHWTLPCEELEGVWENLIFDNAIQIKLLEYVRTAILFTDKNVNPNLVSWNRYQYTKLLEINSHSLFSKWYSESGKMVQRMFDQIWKMVEDENAFVCVLIDEVESLTAARKAAMSGNEPSDSIRVVNALLTQIDRLKKKKNVLILTTSNITEAIDIAFIDRADIKLYIGFPSTLAIFNILNSGLEELRRTGIINFSATQPMQSDNVPERLYEIANSASGMSGRTIRKLPFLAYAGYIQTSETSVDEYLNALQQTVRDEELSNLRLENAAAAADADADAEKGTSRE
ncbi:Pachytene checkpoint protein 2 [Modicella reniformis]|uniref:Pachytene checkpoint protein 2 n=1 Tax=Modicella reniformis TaxID=1440133 RepID=A0A9P6LXZ8_9FUNG|nr:Pachytene checkpoint protein 2 [Modicella reniformis]